MRKGTLIPGAAILLALVISLPVLAAQNGAAGKGEGMQRLIAADANGDGRVTFDEAKAAFPKATREQFNKMDRNQDGVLSRADMPQAKRQAGSNLGEKLQRLRAADRNNDGRITFDEAKAAFPKLTQERFAKLDKNGDGVLSMEDRQQGGNGKLAQRLKQADANGDGRLSFEEAKAAFPKLTQERFNQNDHNHDGFLSPEDRSMAVN